MIYNVMLQGKDDKLVAGVGNCEVSDSCYEEDIDLPGLLFYMFTTRLDASLVKFVKFCGPIFMFSKRITNHRSIIEKADAFLLLFCYFFNTVLIETFYSRISLS